MTIREKLLRLVDELATTLRIVETQRHDPLLQALARAPEDDEPWTDEDEAAVTESRADFAAGLTLSHEEMLRMYRRRLRQGAIPAMARPAGSGLKAKRDLGR